MKPYAVIFREPNAHPLDEPEVFLCQADDHEHAEEQAENSYPNAVILWISEGSNHSAALSNYYDSL
jgi:hypothetical protein